ncbi:class II aldolase/adducin family protein [Streptomyces sp. DSM 44917]|uniref:Class II aldolase/adducin family protein n=1 Tax=Streptomyces boetiae TaxID=3075541 RepID=A0ABU2L2V9_9ACTN|nr:class II aldolase/adducin family protein [Streptomyces sp. DSM 44917]MDT0305897.1 class II aldolase/adducin family protein [Streptomyces sp. DSM 44917]
MPQPADEAEARVLAVRASHALAAAGQGDMVWGHVAVRDPGGRGIWIKAPGWGLEEVREDRLQLVSPRAEVLAGEGAPHKECHIHLAVLAARPDLACSVHTHAPAAVAFAALDVPLLPLSHEGALFGGADVPRFRRTGGLVSTPALGEELAAVLGEAPAALLPKHGLVAAGTGVPAAVMHAVLLERACRTQLAAASAGPVRVFSDAAEAAAKRAECWPESQLEAGWQYLVRRAARAASGAPRPPADL